MKKLIMFIMTLVMCLSLCACEKADDYEVAVALMDAGKYEEAMSAFEQLGEYEDSAVKAKECEAAAAWENAVALFEDDDYVGAWELFKNMEDSEKTEESDRYIMECAWGMLREYLEEEGPLKVKDTQYDVENDTQVESICQIEKQGKRVIATIQSTEIVSYPIVNVTYTTVTDTTVSFDGKETQPELKAEAKHTMKGKNGASTFRNVGTCLWDIASYEADTPVKWTEYIHIGTDGEMDDTRSAPAFDSRVTMQRTIIAASLEQLIEDADCGVSMADLGFTNY